MIPNPDAHGAYQEVLRLARRCVRTDAEAHDLTQDALLIALDRGLSDWADPAVRPWLHGVVRKRAALIARTEGRRRRRDQTLHDLDEVQRAAWSWSPSFLSSLPPSLRCVARLASADLCAAEICWLLGIQPTALRVRLSALRKAVHAEAELPTVALAVPAMALGPRRAPVLAGLKRLPGQALATHDPDGHTLIFRIPAYKSPGRGNS